MGFADHLKSGEFLRIVENQPPKGVDVEKFLGYAEAVRGRVDAILVPELQTSVMRLSSLSASKILLDKGFEAIHHTPCGHKNRIALQSELLGAFVLGLDTVWITRGDSPNIGDNPDAKEVFDLDENELLAAAKRLQEGYDLAGNDLDGSPSFTIGASFNAGATGRVLDLEVLEIEKKIRLGADFFITSPIFDIDQFTEIMEKVRPFKTPVIATVMILKSVGMARYINKHIDGVMVPDAVIGRMMKEPDKEKASIEITASLIRSLQALCQGVCIQPIGWESKVPQVLDACGF
jgi:5,10-methylenetetrahydrofolate reductase